MSTYDDGPHDPHDPHDPPGAPDEEAKGDGREDPRPSLTAQVRRRRTDQQFFLRLRDAIQQNHKALERLGT